MLNYRLHNNVRGAKKGYSLIVVVKYMGGGRGGGGNRANYQNSRHGLYPYREV